MHPHANVHAHAHGAPSPDAIVRLSPKKAPFRRANVHFETLDPVYVRYGQLTPAQLILLGEEPLVDVDGSEDGVSWQRLALPSDAAEHVTDPALSPERAIDPTGPIVPRAPIATEDGFAAPPEAADPAVPLARPEGEPAAGPLTHDAAGDRRVTSEAPSEAEPIAEDADPAVPLARPEGEPAAGPLTHDAAGDRRVTSEAPSEAEPIAEAALAEAAAEPAEVHERVPEAHAARSHKRAR